jgi:VWFA-related protein
MYSDCSSSCQEESDSFGMFLRISFLGVHSRNNIILILVSECDFRPLRRGWSRSNTGLENGIHSDRMQTSRPQLKPVSSSALRESWKIIPQLRRRQWTRAWVLPALIRRQRLATVRLRLAGLRVCTFETQAWPRTLRRCFWALLSLSVAGVGVSAPQRSQERHPSVFKVQTEVVNVYAVVKDHKGRLISNLTQNDFKLSEDGTPQQIRYFSRVTRVPLTLAIMVDTSPSQGRVLSTEQRQADDFLREVMQPKDLACVLHFDIQVELLQDFTASLPMLSRAIDQTVINGGARGPLPSTFPLIGGATHLYDAVWLASRDLMGHQVGRKVLILLTDGQDQGSYENVNSALEAAVRADTMIFSIDILDRGFYGIDSPTYNGGQILRKFSGTTGGEVIRVTRRSKTAEAFREIADELRTQYWLGYTPSNREHDGTYRAIRVEVDDKHYRVQARKGYYAPSP